MDTKAAQKQLVGLISQHLSESIPVTRILTYKPNKNGSVTGKFESLDRVFNFVFNGSDVRYKPAMNADSALFSDYYLERFDAAPKVAKGSRALPKCTAISYSCKGEKGVRCLPLTQHCKIGTDAIGRERLNKIRVLSKSLATDSKDNSKLEAAKAKLIEQRMALAVENRAKRVPKSLGEKNEPIKTIEPKPKSKAKAKNRTKEISQGIPDLSFADFSKYLKGELPKKQMQAIEAAINRPLVDPKKAATHKPNMSKKDAEKYVKDSAYGTQSIWHGNRDEVTDSIFNDGADPSKNVRGVYGQGVYFGADEAIARSYADTAIEDQGGKANLIEAKFAIQKPYKIDSGKMAVLSVDISNLNNGKFDPKALSDYVKAKGYDSIHLTDLAYLVAFDKAQVVSVSNKTIKEGAKPGEEEEYFWV